MITRIKLACGFTVAFVIIGVVNYFAKVFCYSLISSREGEKAFWQSKRIEEGTKLQKMVIQLNH